MLPGATYHIYTHANGFENLFRNKGNYQYFLRRYNEYIAGVGDTLAYCLMPNHLHLLVRIKSEIKLTAYFKSKNLNLKGLDSGSKKDLSGLEKDPSGLITKDLSGLEKDLSGLITIDLSGLETKNLKGQEKDLSGLETKNLKGLKEDLSGLTILQFSHLFNAYAKSYNKVFKRRGSLFIRSFKRKEITSDNYFTGIIYYIHNNPVRHGFVKQIADWPWSSYHDFLSPQITPVQQEVIDWFGNLQQFILFHQ